ncbi:hypothetical protein [Phytomonospora endophytica]|uniref:Abortive infection protein n=1 Tax=Phytomonospora endophytica TaxID=714109 RepID=A0A841FM89_9ACTN|nr:hypothetical protein [Phytomonospora endophytica]MBB6038431.1 hypothetical protein [Phytomonospora endophytica]GIG64360.1 hypothetical protein Pen01_06550 [Phytomonospora endophytica]
MRARGINYDTGFLPGDGSRASFTPEVVARDLRVIAEELHCDAVRISGRDPGRLSFAAERAAEHGLEIWFAPFPVDVPRDEMLDLFADCAARAETLRAGGASVRLVAGCEFSAFAPGFIPGDTYGERLHTIATADQAWWNGLGPIITSLNGYVAGVAAKVREHFAGPVTYAAAPWEFIDWTPFDYVGADAYRAAYNEATFTEEIAALGRNGKPVAVLEYGTCAYTGAGARGGMAWQAPADAVADEGEQVRYFTELLDVFEAQGVDTALWFTFAGFGRVGEADLGSYGVVRMLTEESEWERKALFAAMAERYGR